MRTVALRGRIVTDYEVWEEGTVLLEGGRVADVSRVMLVALSPPEKRGEFFGLFSLAGKLSAVMGPAITAGLLWAFEDLGTVAYRIAIGSLALVMALGLFLLLRVPDAHPEPGAEETLA